MSKLPPPEQWALVTMTEHELAEEIERYIDFVDEHGRSVHLPMEFVRHFMTRDDGVLPTVVAIAALPIILADGGVLAMGDGIDESRGIEFVIPKEVMELLPRRADLTPDAVKKAMKFLTDEWLGDVATNYAGKCTLIAAGMTVIERSLLPDRPAFFVTAGRRGSGKTTALSMLIMAVTGMRPAAAAWSTNEEERRKALLSYFLYGVAYIVWDNIPRGAQITCPHIEKSCTAAYYSDRRLGASEMVATAASTIHFFTGNNIGPRGDLASRSLSIRLDVDRADPENREFKHPDPIGWTDEHRSEILQAFYTILLGNPKLDEPRDAPMQTRFKLWWRLIGSAIEYGAQLAKPDDKPDDKVDFVALFRGQDEQDDDDTTLAQALAAMADTWKGTFTAKDVCKVIDAFDHEHQATLRDYLCPTLPDGHRPSPKSIGWALKRHVGEPVQSGNRTLVLRKVKEDHAVGVSYQVKFHDNHQPRVSGF
jgi:hypothetical protein